MSDHVVPPAPPAAATRAIEAPRTLAAAALALAGAVTAAQVVLAVLAATLDGLGDPERLTAYDVVSLVWIPVLVATYVVTCLWLHRARVNSEALSGAEDHVRGRVWVWLGWWVPVVSFWFPWQVVRDVQQTSVRAAKQKPVDLGLWWACWILTLLMLRAHSRLDVPSPTFSVVIAAVMAVALWRWALVVRRITDAQAAVAGGPGGTDA